MKLLSLHHVAIVVPNVTTSISWYHRVLGLQQVHREWGINPALMVAEHQTGIALFQQGAAEAHIAFDTDPRGFLQAQKELREQGIEFEYNDHGTMHSIYFRSPDGQRLEITANK